MGQSAIRRNNMNNSELINRELFIASKPKYIQYILRVWYKLWEILYFLVSVITYLFLVTGVIASFYYCFIDFKIDRFILSGLFTILNIVVNMLSPKN